MLNTIFKTSLTVALFGAAFLSGIYVCDRFYGETYVYGQEVGSLKEDYFQGNHAYTSLGAGLICTETNGLSMAPAFFPGNTVCYVPFNESMDITEGDIIIYEKEGGGRIAHAVLTIANRNGSNTYLTKGYNNVREDPLIVTDDQIIGVVTEVRFT